MVRSAIQLYTLRNIDKSVPELLELVAEAGFEGVEFYGPVGDADTASVLDTLDDTGLEAIGPHISTDRLEDDLEDVLATYGELGCQHYTEPWFGPEHYETEASVEALGDRLDAVGKRLAEHGVSFHYHNHDHEFADLGDTTGLEHLIDSTDVLGFQIDAGTAVYAGHDPAALVRRVGDRATLFHAKDCDVETGESTPLGEGDVDVAACVDAFADVGGEWFIFEYEGEDPIETLEPAADLLDDLL